MLRNAVEDSVQRLVIEVTKAASHRTFAVRIAEAEEVFVDMMIVDLIAVDEDAGVMRIGHSVIVLVIMEQVLVVVQRKHMSIPPKSRNVVMEVTLKYIARQ